MKYKLSLPSSHGMSCGDFPKIGGRDENKAVTLHSDTSHNTAVRDVEQRLQKLRSRQNSTVSLSLIDNLDSHSIILPATSVTACCNMQVSLTSKLSPGGAAIQKFENEAQSRIMHYTR